MKLSEDSGKIIIKYVPFSKWIVGGILFFVFIILFSAAGYLYFRGSTNDFIESPEIFLIISGLGVCFLSIKTLRAPLVVLTINAKTQSIDIFKQRFYGRRTQRLYFHQITKFRSLKSKTNFSEKYFLALVLTNLKTTKFGIPTSSDKREAMKLTRKLNKFIKTNKSTI